jgi:hypothetical protein
MKDLQAIELRGVILERPDHHGKSDFLDLTISDR